MKQINYDFKNKTVLITAGSKGIGFELAKQFLNYGAKVALCSRNSNNLKKVRIFFSKLYKKNKFLIIKHDLNNLNKSKKIISLVHKHFKKNIDILINNSGGPPSKTFENTNNKDWDSALNVNLLSGIHFTKLVVKGMKKNKWGRIINLASLTAKEPVAKMILSNVTRAGMSSFSKTLAIELGKLNITVNTILSGGCLTDRVKDLIRQQYKGQNFKTILKKIEKSVPVQRVAETEEFVQAIIFLCSDNASYINGVALPIDGGASKSIF